MIVNIGKGITLEVDAKRLTGDLNDPTTPLGHLFYIGARNVLMDSHASITKEEADYVTKSREVASAKLQALYNGEVRVNGERGPRLDPVDAEARRIALGAVQKALRAQGKKLNVVKTDEMLELVKNHLAKNPKIFKLAKQIVDLRSEA